MVLITSVVTAREYHVSVNGSDNNDGSASNPFKTINFAAQLAQPGDIITVHAGTYREWINPARGGESDSKELFIRLQLEKKWRLKVLKLLQAGKKEKNGIWKVTIPNSFFGDYNPYQDSIYGDWFSKHGRIHHTGEVFLNGKSLYEKENIDKVINPVADTKIKDKEGSTYTWYCAE